MTRLASNDVNIAETLGRRMPRSTPATLERDRHLADTIPTLEHRLVTARGQLAAAYRTPVGAAELQKRFLAVTVAYNDLITASEAAYRVAVGPTVKRSLWRIVKGRHSNEATAALARLEAARRGKEQHLLRAAAAVRVPNSVRTSSHAAYTPHNVAGMHFDPVPPLGPEPTRHYGVDLQRTLDAEARDAVVQVARPATQVAAPTMPGQASSS